MRRKAEDFHDGAKDGLTPLEPLDLEKITDFDELLRAMGKTAFGGRSLGEAAEVLAAMVQDPECTVVGTFSGAMSVAKMGLMICDMIDRGWLKVIITTGALIAHGFIETLGRAHYKYPGPSPTGSSISRATTASMTPWRWKPTWIMPKTCSGRCWRGWTASRSGHLASLCRELGRYLAEQTDSPGILRNAYLKGVPVFIPAFTDSELGLDLAGYMVRQALAEGKDLSRGPGVGVPEIQPLPGPGSLCPESALAATKLGIFTVGGGVPRNWAQQVAPYLELLHGRLDLDLPEVRFHYGVRLCPEPAHWGGLERLHLQGGGLLGEIRPRRTAAATPRCCATPPSPGPSS